MTTDTLTKSTLPGHPGTPGIPGTPATPAYDYTIDFYVPVYVLTPGSGGQAPGTGGNFGDGSGTGIGLGPGGPGQPPPLGSYNTQFSLTYQHIVETIHVGGAPATVGTPGEPETINDLQAGWNSGARSVSTLAGDGQYQFSVNSGSVGVITGFSATDPDGSYRNIGWGIYCTNGQYQVIESGVDVTALATFATTDVFTIRRLGTNIAYYKGSTLIYTSTVQCSGTMLVDSSLYMGGDAIINPSLSGTVSSTFRPTSGGLNGTMDGLVGGAGDTTVAIKGALTGLGGTATSWNVGTVTGSLGGISGDVYGGGITSFARGSLTSISGYAEAGLITPQYAVAIGRLPLMGGAAFGLLGNAGGITGSLGGITGLSANYAYSEVRGNLSGLHGVAFDVRNTPSYAILVAPSYEFYSIGHSETLVPDGYGVVATHGGAYGVSAYGGADANLTGPSYFFTAGATATIMGRATMVGPVCTLVSSGTTTNLASVNTTYRGRYSVAAYGGANASMTLPAGEVIACDGIVGSIARVSAGILPRGYVTSSGTAHNFGGVDAILPTLVSVPSARASLAPGRYGFSASGHQVVSVDYEAYSITLLDGDRVATTRFSDYPFDRIVRFGSTYYGVAADGLYALSGNAFGSDAIVALVETAAWDFGKPSQKRARSLFLAGHIGDDLALTVTTDEETEDDYSYDPPLEDGAKNHRYDIGRGVEGRYFSYRLSNAEGQDFQIDEMTPEVDVLRRAR